MKNSKEFSLIAKGALIIFVSLFLGRLFSYLFTLVVARLGPRQYGSLSISFSIIQFLIFISLLGFHGGAERFVAFFNGKKNKALLFGTIFDSVVFVTIMSISLGIVFFVFTPFFASIFHEPLLIPLFRIIAIALPFFSLTSLLRSIISGFKKGDIATFIGEVVNHGLKLVFALIFIYVFLYNIIGAAFSYLFALIFTTLILTLYLIHLLDFKAIANIKLEHNFKALLFFSVPLAFTGFFAAIIGKIDTVMIGSFISSSATGIYNVALPTSALLLIFSGAFTTMLFPIMTEYYAQKKNFSKIYHIVNKWIFLSTFPLFIIFILFSQQILKIMFGAEYVLGASSLIVLSFGTFIFALNAPTLSIFRMINNTKLIFYIFAFSTILNIILNWFLIQKIGIIGGAIATTIAYLSIALLSIYLIKKKLPELKFFNRKYIPISISAIIPGAIIFFLKSFIEVNFLISLALGLFFCLIYIVLLFLTHSFETEDKEIFKKIKKRLFA